MDGNLAVSGSWATHTPPTALTICAPAVPLLPMPDSSTHTARSRCSSARLRKKSSTGRWCPRFSTGAPRCSLPKRMVSVWPGRIT